MRNIAVSLFLLCVGSIIVGGCGPNKEEIQKQTQKQEIQYVMSKVNGKWNLDDWEIKRIDLRSCPADFQEAFLLWKGTERSPEEKRSGTGLFSSNEETPEETSVRMEKEKTKKAVWIKVETVALRYGVQTGM